MEGRGVYDVVHAFPFNGFGFSDNNVGIRTPSPAAFYICAEVVGHDVVCKK